MSSSPSVTRIGSGVYRVVQDGRAHIVYVAGSPADRWVHCEGLVFHRPFTDDSVQTSRVRRPGADAHQSLSAPMPATVLQVLVAPGRSVKKGETLLILEAMKMELPVRSAADGTVKAVLCREGELVQPGTTLVELE
jgi:biotin carboxyl carrier protein